MDDTLEGTARTVLHAGDDAGGAHGDDGAPAAENAGPRAARADASFAGGTGRAIDPAAFLRISLDPALALMTPAHWAYELVKAVEANDAEFVDVRVKSVAAAFDTASLAEPLGPSGQSLLHVAAFLNRPEIAITLLCALDRSLAAAATAQKLSVRREALNTKTGDADSAAHRAALARDLDRIERVRVPAAPRPPPLAELARRSPRSHALRTPAPPTRTRTRARRSTT